MIQLQVKLYTQTEKTKVKSNADLWGYSEILEKHGLVMRMLELPSNWPFVWFLKKNPEKDKSTVWIVCICKASDMDDISFHFNKNTKVNVAITPT